jgi:hypothetical protein
MEDPALKFRGNNMDNTLELHINTKKHKKRKKGGRKRKWKCRFDKMHRIRCSDSVGLLILGIFLVIAVAFAIGMSAPVESNNIEDYISKPSTTIKSNFVAQKTVGNFMKNSTLHNQCYSCKENNCIVKRKCDSGWYCALHEEGVCFPSSTLNCENTIDCEIQLYEMELNPSTYCFSCINAKCFVNGKCTNDTVCDRDTITCLNQQEFAYNITHYGDSMTLERLRVHLTNLPGDWNGNTRSSCRSKWTGVYCSVCHDESNVLCIDKIQLNNFGISGGLSTFDMSTFIQLNTLDLRRNKITSLPRYLPKELETLLLEDNDIVDNIPNWNQYKQLRNINLNNNIISGYIKEYLLPPNLEMLNYQTIL